jgi:hypothetical protein
MQFLEMERDEARDTRQMLEAMYLHGGCVCFAIALSRIYGDEVKPVGLFKDGLLYHAGVHLPEFTYMDVRGKLTFAEFRQGFDGDLIEIHPDGLHTLDPGFTELKVSRAIDHIGWLFPEWVEHKDTPGMVRLRTFIEALEGLCKEHGYYLRGNDMLVYDAYGDEKGFDVLFSPLLAQSRLRRIL